MNRPRIARTLMIAAMLFAGLRAHAQAPVPEAPRDMLRGRVTDPNGDPIQMVNLQLIGPRPMTTRTNAAGWFLFDKVEADEVAINIVTDRHEPVTRKVPAEEFADVRFTLFPLYRVEGALRAGLPAPPVAGVEWVRGDASALQPAKGRRLAVAFVSVKNPACRRVVAQLQDVAASGQAGAPAIVLIHDSGATALEIGAYLDAKQVPFPVARATSPAYDGWYSPVFVAWRATRLPTVVLVGSDGRVISGRVAAEDLPAIGALPFKN